MSSSGTKIEKTVRQLVQQMAGQRLPSERDLAMQLTIPRSRLRAILTALQHEGLIESRLGSGTYAVEQQTGHLRRVALLIDEKLKLGDDPFFSLLLEHLQASVQAIGAECMVERISSRGQVLSWEECAVTLGLAGRDLLEAQRPQNAPMVGLLLDTATRSGRRASVFQLEDREAGQAAARFLWDRGCREVVFLGRRDIPASQERLAGVEEVLQAVGAQPRFVESHLNFTDGLRLGQSLNLDGESGPVGIIATNDWLALGLRTGLRHREAPGERDTPLLSFDGLPLTADPALEITSLSIPIQTIADDAVAELQRLHRSLAAAGRSVRYPLSWPASEAITD